MLAGTAITEFIGDLSSLENGNHMFYADNQMTVFEVPHMNSLTNAEYMFYNTYIEDFDTEMNSLESAEFMFYQATKLKSFKSPLPSLKYGKSMFYASNQMDSFDVDLPLLEDGENMFRTSKLKSFVSDTHSLKNGNYMFSNTVLETVDMDLSSLERGSRMFNYCKLSGESVRNIYETLPQINQNYWSNKDGYGVLEIGINSVYSSTASTNLSRLNAFAVSAGFSDWQSLKAAFDAKGWIMGWYYAASTKLIEV
jgi:ASC-1-like (ASCH) protein